jgi:4,5-DOPA dioxygenase extradiol
MNQTLPVLFISHGAPTLAIDGSPAHEFLGGYGKTLGNPSAIVVLSAHFEARIATVTSGERPETIYDFGGFPDELYRIVYPAPGEPALAAEIAQILESNGITVRRDARRGLDHGAWVPLVLMYPAADVPVVQLSIDTSLGTGYHHRLGELLSPLRERGVLIIGSGSATHNLGSYFRGAPGDPSPPWVTDFDEWLAERIGAGDVEALLDYRRRAPHARENHPTEEHYVPLLCALGAAGRHASARRVHHSYEHGVLSMDAYAFSDAGN